MPKKSAKEQWIVSLALNGLKPVMDVVLVGLSREQALRAEHAIATAHLSRGLALLQTVVNLPSQIAH